MNIDEKAMKIIARWKKGEYKNDIQSEAKLQSLIASALIEQERDTRCLCAQALLWRDEDMLSVYDAHDICMNAKGEK